MIVSIDNDQIIEMIISREIKFTDFIFKPSFWEDEFVVELLKWYDNEIEDIPLKDGNYDNWKTYYEQIVRILYYFVVYQKLYESEQLVMKIFDYLFSVDKDDNSKNDYDIISSEKLIDVYNEIRGHITKYKYIKMQDFFKNLFKEKPEILIGKWKNEKMENKFNKINIIRHIDTNTVFRKIYIDDDEIIQSDDYFDDEIIQSNDELIDDEIIQSDELF